MMPAGETQFTGAEGVKLPAAAPAAETLRQKYRRRTGLWRDPHQQRSGAEGV